MVDVVTGFVVVQADMTDEIVGFELERTAGVNERADNSWAVGVVICSIRPGEDRGDNLISMFGLKTAGCVDLDAFFLEFDAAS